MEAASGGYAEVGRVLLDKGADVNAPPVPSSRDTALTIAADKGHYKFCELLINRWGLFWFKSHCDSSFKGIGLNASLFLSEADVLSHTLSDFFFFLFLLLKTRCLP